MSEKDPSPKPSLKQRAKEELIDFGVISLYLAFFFCALTTYTMLLMRKYDADTLNYTFAIINALVIAKVILLGEIAHLGRRFEARPLFQSVLYKAFVYCLLVLAFHFAEEFVKRLIHGRPFGAVWYDIRVDELVARTIVVFCTFIPLFAFRELRRVLGTEKIYALFFEPRATTTPSLSAGK